MVTLAPQFSCKSIERLGRGRTVTQRTGITVWHFSRRVRHPQSSSLRPRHPFPLQTVDGLPSVPLVRFVWNTALLPLTVCVCVSRYIWGVINLLFDSKSVSFTEQVHETHYFELNLCYSYNEWSVKKKTREVWFFRVLQKFSEKYQRHIKPLRRSEVHKRYEERSRDSTWQEYTWDS